MTHRSPSSLLRLMWLASPALPVGGFSYSEGLEAAVEAGHVSDAVQATDWLVDQLHLGLARSDLPWTAHAFGLWKNHAAHAAHAACAGDEVTIDSLNARVLMTRETAEFRLQTEQMGRSLVQWMQHSEQAMDPRVQRCASLKPAPSWPVAFALAGVLAGAGVKDLLLAFAFSWAENMVQAAMKAVPLGQLAAQRILQRLTDEIPQAVDEAEVLPFDACQVMTPMLAILSSQHEAQYSRLFRS